MSPVISSPRDVARCLDGSPASRAALFVGIEGIVRTAVRRALDARRREAGGRDILGAAEDIAQDVFVVLLSNDARALRVWDPERGASFERFVAFIARREVQQVLRSPRRNPWFEVPSSHVAGARWLREERTPERRAEAREAITHLSERMHERLTPLGWTYFVALFCEGRGVQEVADAQDRSADAIYAWRSRIKRELRVVSAQLSETCARRRSSARRTAPGAGRGRNPRTRASQRSRRGRASRR